MNVSEDARALLRATVVGVFCIILMELVTRMTMLDMADIGFFLGASLILIISLLVLSASIVAKVRPGLIGKIIALLIGKFAMIPIRRAADSLAAQKPEYNSIWTLQAALAEGYISEQTFEQRVKDSPAIDID
jgi:uncharacterized membrane protein YczE